MKIQNIQKYIELYNTESHLFKVVGLQVRERGYFLFEEFYSICMWKSARQKQRYKRNKDGIKEISKKVFAENDEKIKMKILCELEGVNIPMASALLTVVNPEKYAVIDIRCLEALENKGLGIGNTPSLKTWIKYLKIVRNLAKENKVTPREIDMALFAMHREDLNKQDYKNLYNK